MKSTLPKSQNAPKNGAILPPSGEEAAKSEKQPAVNRTPTKSGPADQHRKHLTLEASEARYRRLFETAKDGILILDGDTGRIIDANPFLQDMLGYSEGELIGKALWEIGPVRNIAASQDAMRQLQYMEYIRYEDIPLETKGRKRRRLITNYWLWWMNSNGVIGKCRCITA